MPLINLQTDLRSLRFGNDRPGGGSSNQPYIQKPIPSPEDSPSNLFNTGGKDILNRGGLLAPIKGVNDVSRLSQMFFDFKSPSGPLFTAKQNLLSRTSVKTEASKGAGYGGGGVNQGLYLPTSTILQAGVGFTGTHLNLLGLNPFDPVSPDGGGLLPGIGLNSYFNIVKNQDTENNRLVKLTENPDSVNILEYGGGPGSILGIGKTRIQFADQRTGENNPLSVNNPEYFNKGGVKLHTPDDTNSYLLNITGSQQIDTNNSINNESLSNGGKSPFTVNNKLIGDVVPEGEIKTYASTPRPSDPNSYLSNITGSSIIDTNNPENNESLSNSSKSPFTLNNKLIGDVVPEGEIKTYASSKNTIPPQTTYATSLLQSRDASSVTLLYNKLIETSPNSFNSRLPLDSYVNAFGFSVYQDKDITKYTPLQRANNSITLLQDQIISIPENSGKLVGSPAIMDFRDGFTVNSSTIMSLSPDYKTKNIEERVNLGNPGKAKNVLRYSVNQPALDKINASGFYSLAGPNHSKNRNDLVKFSIGILQNNGYGISNYIHFRAFLEGFSDNYSATWSDVQYVGRGDKFYNYGGFTREISMGWTVYAQSKAELIPMYKKLNYLATSLAPDYSSGGFMRGSLARLTVGGYLYNQLGIIKGITYTIPDESTWEIGIDEKGNYDSSVKELAHMIKVSGFTFIPIQDKVPEKGKSKFIQLSNGGNTNWDSGIQMPVDNPKTTKEVEVKTSAENDTPTLQNPQTEIQPGQSIPIQPE